MSKSIEDRIKEVLVMVGEDKELKRVVYIGIGLLSLYVLYNALSKENKTICGIRLLSQAAKSGII